MSRELSLIMMVVVLIAMVLGMHQCAKASLRKQKSGDKVGIPGTEETVAANSKMTRIDLP